MFYMGINKDIISNCSQSMIKLINTDTFIIDFIKLDSYHDCMNMMIDKFKFPKYNGMDKIFDMINDLRSNNFFPYDFKIKFIVELLKNQYCSTDFDIVMSISPLCNVRYNTPSYGLFDICVDGEKIFGSESMIKRMGHPYKTYLNMEPTIIMKYDMEKIEITKFKVNEINV